MPTVTPPIGATASMFSESRISDLLLLFEERGAQTAHASLSSLCGDDQQLRDELASQPELREEIERRLDKLRRVERVIACNHPSRATAPPEIPGYTTLDAIGRGGMGVVYRARNVTLNRDVALKLMLAGPFSAPTTLARFRAEAEVIARLSHPNIVQIYEMGEAGGVPFLALEFVDGKSLKETMAGKPMEPRAAVACVLKIARATEHAHLHGIVHRDLKPSNVLVTPDGETKITDFGLAKCLEDDSDLTASGEAPGTPSYMAPEQVTGEAIGPATDVYALGAMLYECLTGHPPFLGTTTGETLVLVRNSDPVPPSRVRPGVPASLEAICLHCLAKNARGRYPTAAALADDLERWIDGRIPRVRPAGAAMRLWKWTRRRPTIAALVAVSVTAAIVVVAIGTAYTRHLRDSRATADALRAGAERSAVIAKSHAYAATMRTAQWAWQTSNRRVFTESLDSYSDSPLRGFEWHYLQHHSERGQRRLRATHPVEIDSVAFAPDGKHVATANRDGTVEIWTHPAGKHKTSFRAHEKCANLLRYPPSGRLLATASCDATIRLWDAESLELVREMMNPGGPVDTFQFDPSGQTIYSAGREQIVRAWDVSTGVMLRTFEVATEAGHLVSLDVDGKILAGCGEQMPVTLWETDSSARLGSIQTSGATAVRLVDGSRLLAIAEPASVRILSVPEGQQRIAFPTHGRAYFLATGAEGRMLYAATDMGTLEAFDLRRGSHTASVPLHARRLTDVAVSPDGRYLMTASEDHTAVLLDLEHSNPTEPFQRVPLPDADECEVALDIYSATLAIAFRSGTRNSVILREAGDVQRETRLPRPASWPIGDIYFEMDGNYLVVIHRTDNDLTERWRLTGAKPALVMRGLSPLPAADPQPLDYHKHAIAGNSLKLTDTRTGDVVDRVTVETGAEDFRLVGNGRWMTYQVDKLVRVWNVSKREKLPPFPAPGVVNTTVLSHDGKLLAVASESGAHLFEFPGGKLRHDLLGHEGGVFTVAFSHDQKTLATSGHDKTVRLWNVATGQEMLTLAGHSADIYAIAFSRDDKSLLSFAPGRPDGTGIEVLRWRAD